MCPSCLIVITPNSFYSTQLNSTNAVDNYNYQPVYNHQQGPSTRRITCSSQELKALNNMNQSGTPAGGDKPKPRPIPYKAIATIRKLQINQKPIRSRHDRLQRYKQKGINRNNLQNIFISEDIVSKPNTQCKIGTISVQSIRNKDTFLTQEISTNSIDVTLSTETWLNGSPQDTAWQHQSDLIQSGYAISIHNGLRRKVE